MKISVEIDMPNQAKAIVKLLKNKEAFVKNWANSAAMEARNNARSKGGRRYWKDLARSIQVKNITTKEIDVFTNYQGATIKQFGGVITPTKKKFLTIPIANEAKGKSAYELETPTRELFVLPKTRLLGYATGAKKKKFKPLFVLAKKSVQKPDPWFPTNQRLRFLANREAQFLFRKEQELWNSQK